MTLGCAAVAAHAESFFQIEAGIGGSAFNKGPDGYWFQQPFPHSLSLYAPAIEAGFTGDVWRKTSWGVAWHADYVNLGRDTAVLKTLIGSQS